MSIRLLVLLHFTKVLLDVFAVGPQLLPILLESLPVLREVLLVLLQILAIFSDILGVALEIACPAG